MLKIISILVFIPLFSMAQLNMQQLGYLDFVSSHNSDLSDTWVYNNGRGRRVINHRFKYVTRKYEFGN